MKIAVEKRRGRSNFAAWNHKHYYHRTPNYYEKFEPMKEWCREQFGDNWKLHAWIWRFRYKKDYVLFLLRWM